MGRKLGTVPLLGQLGPYLTQCGRGRGLPQCQVSSWFIQPLGHNTPPLGTDRQRHRQDNGPTAYGKPLYKRSTENVHFFLVHLVHATFCRRMVVRNVSNSKRDLQKHPKSSGFVAFSRVVKLPVECLRGIWTVGEFGRSVCSKRFTYFLYRTHSL